jgi:hypothetical protein
MFLKLNFFLSLTLFTFTLFAQNNLQSPSDFLPHKLGEDFTPHYMVVDYFQHVAKNSEHVQLVKYGESNQKRPLYLAFISSKKNLENLEEIRKNNLRLTGLEKGDMTGTSAVAVVWLSHGVHGNEAGASESSLQSIYELANPKNIETKKWLENTVVIIDPSINPDGYSRYTHWNRNVSNQDPDPVHIAREHEEPWPGGRVNHYLFDLNRDWAWATQIETRQRLKIYQQWMPHIHADFHEQGHNDHYYFAPAAQPYHAYITKWQSDFQYEIGENHAKYFDAEGWLYFTREVFDLFYPSYGDTYPTFNGAIGMTYEQAGHSFSGRAVIMENGDTLTLKDRVDHHETTALSTVEMASKNANRLVDQFKAYFDAAQNNPPGQYKTFIIKGTNNQAKLKRLTELLDRHQIRYGRAGTSVSVPAFDYVLGKDLRHEVAAGDLIISAFQPKGLLAQVLFDPRSDLVDSLTYDITAWSLMYAYGLEGYASTQRLDPSGDFIFEKKSIVSGQKKPYAYVVKWKSLQDARFLGALLQSNIKARYAENSFNIDGNQYMPGTLVITKGDNRKNVNFNETVVKIAKEYEVEIMGVSTGFARSGSDLGSGSMVFIEKPTIAILSGEQTYPIQFGQVWYYFEQDLNYPITNINADKLDRADLDEFNVLILPEGRYIWNDKVTQKITDWVAKGGRLIAIGAANGSLEDKSGFALTKYAKDIDKSMAKAARDKAQLMNRTQIYRDKVRAFLPQSIPGAIYKIKLDNSHPLGFGFNDYYFSLKTSGRSYDLLKNVWNVGYIGNKPLISGFVGSQKQQELENSVVFAEQGKGAGSIIYMIDNPLYRGFWEEGKFLFSNAVFFVGQ